MLEYEIAGKFLVDIKKEFRKGDKEIVKVVELKWLKQKGRMIEEFIQEFKKVARESRYEEKPLVKKFKRDMNKTIC